MVMVDAGGLRGELIDGIAIFNAGWWSGLADGDWPRAGLACLVRCKCKWVMWMMAMEMIDPFDASHKASAQS